MVWQEVKLKPFKIDPHESHLSQNTPCNIVWQTRAWVIMKQWFGAHLELVPHFLFLYSYIKSICTFVYLIISFILSFFLSFSAVRSIQSAVYGTLSEKSESVRLHFSVVKNAGLPCLQILCKMTEAKLDSLLAEISIIGECISFQSWLSKASSHLCTRGLIYQILL